MVERSSPDTGAGSNVQELLARAETYLNINAADGRGSALLVMELADALRSHAVAATPTAWRVWWVSLNTARTELFEDHAKATAKAHETGGCVIPLFTGVAQPSLTRKVIEKTLCCPKGCVRSDDCFVDGPPTRWGRSKHEREQADAFASILSISSTNGDTTG